ncbi:septum site-determining protein MinC [Thermosipho ferrireducens]|uniref:Probable septum site-determining protein MinC n=1 Tax=Thermosipho ferrireducens TaxID=2571116 RepID=A0ABX7S6E9_9BACT|nr:septum site-determining protein MinC [Thermosipho ferrireducens]QTA38156.1 septum site-determining protein MinC [Thermosipho ferrireducens]
MIDFKMSREGIILCINDYKDLKNVLEGIRKRFKQTEDFFQPGDRIMLMVENYENHIGDIPKIIEVIDSLGIKVSHILTDMEEKNKEIVIRKKVDMVLQGNTKSGTKIVRKNVRSGQNVIHSGDVIIVGNVHSGAEIIAGGSVVVFGECKGIIRAGTNEGASALVLALLLQSPYIQIGEIRQNISKKFTEPVVVFVKGGKIQIEKYDNLNQIWS